MAFVRQYGLRPLRANFILFKRYYSSLLVINQGECVKKGEEIRKRDLDFSRSHVKNLILNF